jgi:hypothetical protein
VLLCRYETLFDEYVAARPLIPEGSLVEVRFSDLEADMVGEVRRIYAALVGVSFFCRECLPGSPSLQLWQACLRFARVTTSATLASMLEMDFGMVLFLVATTKSYARRLRDFREDWRPFVGP